MARIAHFDLLKFLAIFLVVAGHCIQRSYMSYDVDTDLYYYDGVFKFIYGFHLPLFMAISGFFFYGTLHKYSFNNVVKSRFTRLILPIIAWHIIWSVFNPSEDNAFVSFVRSFLLHYWFLWALFFCSLGVLIIAKLFGNSLKIYILILPVTLCLPNILNIERYVYLFPFFLFGYVLNYPQYQRFILTPFSVASKKVVMLGGVFLFIAYIGMINFYSYEDYIYTSGTCLIKEGAFSFNQLGIDLYRYIVGLVGVVSCYILSLFVKDINIPHYLFDVGTKTLGIYIIHTFFTPIICWFQLDVNYIFVFIEVVVLIYLSYYLTTLIEKNKHLSFLLLGK